MGRHPVMMMMRTIATARPRARLRLPGGHWDDLDPLRPDAIADPTPTYRRLHKRGGAYRCPGRNIWILSEYEEVRDALRAHELLSSGGGITEFEFRTPLPMLLTMDRPDHTRVRRIVARHFTPDSVERWRGLIERVTDQALDRMLASPESDLVAELAIPLPIRVIGALLGWPGDDVALFRDLSDAIIEGFHVGSALGALPVALRVLRGISTLHRYIRRHLAAHRASDDGLLSQLVTLSDEGALSDEEVFWFALLVVVAGNETTTNLIGAMVLALARNPEAYARVREDRTLVPSVVEESLRWASPAQGFFRTARVGHERAGAAIPAGARLLLLFGAANRDPLHFDDPDRFVADRCPSDHLAFGTGIHHCLGAHLARLEARVVLERLAERVHRIELTGEPRWTANPNLRGLARLPVRLLPARAAVGATAEA